MLEKKHLVFLAGATAPFAPPLCTALYVHLQYADMLGANCNIGHKWLQPESKVYLSSTGTDICVFTPITLYSVFRLLTRANKVPL